MDVRRFIAIALALTCFGLSALMYADARDQRDLRAAEGLGRDGRFAEAATVAGELDRRPARARALVVEALALTGLRRYDEALDRFREAAELSPEDWKLRIAWARTLSFAGRAGGARVQLARANQLNPRLGDTSSAGSP